MSDVKTDAPGLTGANEVFLRGRVRLEPERRELPSGTPLVTFRLVVPRSATAGTGSGVDWVDCAVWQAGLQRRVGRWGPGDEVEVRGALRRRFFRHAGGTGTRLEVEVTGGKVVHRAQARDGRARQS